MATPAWMPMPMRSGVVQVVGQAPVQLLDALLHLRRALERGAARRRQVAFQAVEREQAVAAELRVVAAGRAQRGVHLGEELVHEEHHVVGQAPFGEARGIAQVDEHRHDRPLAPLRAARRLARARRGRRSAAGAASPRRRASGGTGRRGARWAAPRCGRAPALPCAPAAAGARGPRSTRTRQVVQRARPPHTEACGRPSSRIASRMLRPTGAVITRPGGVAHPVGGADARAQPAREQRGGERDPERLFEARAPVPPAASRSASLMPARSTLYFCMPPTLSTLGQR